MGLEVLTESASLKMKAVAVKRDSAPASLEFQAIGPPPTAKRAENIVRTNHAPLSFSATTGIPLSRSKARMGPFDNVLSSGKCITAAAW